MRTLLGKNQNPIVKDANEFIAAYCRGKTNGLTIKSAIVKYFKFANQKIEGKEIIEVKYKGRKKLESDITFDKMKEIYNDFPDGVYKDIFTIQALSGCRAIEAITIETRNVKLNSLMDSCEILITQKGGYTRTLKLPIEPMKILLSNPVYQNAERKYLFLPEQYQGLSRDAFLKQGYTSFFRNYFNRFIAVFKRRGQGKYASHDVRRAIIRSLVDGWGLPLAQKAAGHKRIATTQLYCSNAGLDVKGAIEKIYGK